MDETRIAHIRTPSSAPPLFKVLWWGLILALLAGGGYLHRRFLEVASWPQAEAEILESRLVSEHRSAVRSGGSVTHRPLIRYRYEVGGQTYTRSRVGFVEFSSGLRSLVSPVVERHPVGSRTTVHYNPADPGEAVLEPDWGIGLVYFIYAFGGALLLLTLRGRRAAQRPAAARQDRNTNRGPARTGASRGQTSVPDAREIARRAERSQPWVRAVLFVLLGAAWYPFLSFGLRLGDTGDDALGLAVILGSGLVYLALFRRALRAMEQFIRDARAGRIRAVPLNVPSGESRDDRELAELAAAAGGVMGYQRPHADDHLWWMLLLALAAGGVMYWQPWENPVIRAVARDPVRALTSGVPVETQEPARTPRGAARPAPPGQRAGDAASGPAATAVPSPPERSPGYAAFVEQVRAEPSPCPSLLASGPTLTGSADPGAIERALHDALVCKIRRPTYQRAKANWDRKFLLNRGQPFPEEALVRRLRDRLATLRAVPPGVGVHRVPRAARTPVIDGHFGIREWSRALSVPIPDTFDHLYLQADGERLYLALTVPEETPGDAHSSLRVVLHEGLSPWIREEYVIVYGRGYANSGCRISAVRWPEPPPAGGFPPEERWKQVRLNECGLYQHVTAGSSQQGYRIYELGLDRREAGLGPYPVPLRLEVETRPDDTGQRRYIGPLRPGAAGWRIWVSVP